MRTGQSPLRLTAASNSGSILNLYRDTLLRAIDKGCLERRQQFSQAELKQLIEVFPLLTGLVRSHNRIACLSPVESSSSNMPPVNFSEAFSGFLPDVLTPRERQIIRLVTCWIRQCRHFAASGCVYRHYQKSS